MKKVKIILGVEDLQDLEKSLINGEKGLIDTHETYTEKGEKILVEIHV